jgi:hypothetical protein
MSKNFLNYYLEEADKEYVYKLKFACDDFTDEQLDRLESALSKYDLKSITPINRTPIQEHPLDFPNIKNSRVFITTVTLSYPASHDMLRQYVAEHSGVALVGVAVYSQHDARDGYTDHMLALKDGTWKQDYETKLGTDHEQEHDVSGMYGDAYNKAFMEREAAKRKNRRVDVVTNSLIPQQHTDKEGVAEADPGEAGGVSVLGGKK